MREKYVVVDPGKFDTKISVYDPEKKKISIYTYHTKFCAGDLSDDALEANTFIAEIGGKSYKVGNGASESAEITVTKMSEIHRISTLLALAMCADGKTTTDMHVIILSPLSEYSIVAKRNEYVKFILADDDISVKIKTKSDMEPEVRNVHILSKKALPETAGAFFMFLDKYDGGSLGIVDIGGGTAIGAVYNDYEIDHEFDFTDTLGGSVLISSLSQGLTTRFSKYNEKYTLQLLTKKGDDRKLVKNPPDKKLEEESKTLIHDAIINHIKEIRRRCEAVQWSLDFMPLLFTGGTAMNIQDEIKEVFGDNVMFIDEKSNALGALRRLCQQKLGIDIMEQKEEKEKVKEKVSE